MNENLTCSSCDATSKRPARGLPRGWHRVEETHYCGDCWHKKYAMRAVAFPVVSPLDCDWETLNKKLKLMWGQTTSASNWMMTQLRIKDCHRTNQPKMPPMPKVVLYADARKMFPELPSSTIVSLEQSVQRKYRAARFQLIWTGEISLPSFRYPTPFPVHNQAWHTEVGEDNRPVVSVRIGDQRLRLRLKGGAQMRYMRQQFDLIHSGEAPRGELALFRKNAIRTGTAESREDAKHTTIMCKMAAWFPRKDDEGLHGILTVKSTAGSLLEASVRGETIWTYNADQLRRWSAEHARTLQRLAEDQKFENRPEPDFAGRREALVVKYRDRMSTGVWSVVYDLNAFARRRKFAKVVLDTGDKRFCPSLPWFKLEQTLKQDLAIWGCECEVKTGKTEEEKEPAA